MTDMEGSCGRTELEWGVLEGPSSPSPQGRRDASPILILQAAPGSAGVCGGLSAHTPWAAGQAGAPED